MKKQAVWPFDFTGYTRKKDKSVPFPFPENYIMYDDDGVWLSLGDGIQIDISDALKDEPDDNRNKTKALRNAAKKKLNKRK